ncbi:hypothetical protein OAO87_01395 [bacterium]|nr:hypothetical protein [bacterium]
MPGRVPAVMVRRERPSGATSSGVMDRPRDFSGRRRLRPSVVCQRNQVELVEQLPSGGRRQTVGRHG